MKIILVVCFLVATLVAPVSPANASPVPPLPPHTQAVHVASLAAAQQSLVPTRVVLTHSLVKHQTGPTSWCGTFWYTIYSYAAIGMIWWYRVTIPWCWIQGVRITSISHPVVQTHITWPANLGGWEYDGTQTAEQYRLDPTPSRYRNFSQGKFGFCPPRLVCFFHLYPYLVLDVNRLGQGTMIAYGGTTL